MPYNNPGERVPKGGGTVRVFPNRPDAKARTQDGCVPAAVKSSSTNPILGFKGVSPLFLLKFLKFRESNEPDDLYQIFVGFFRSQMALWFESTNHTSLFYIGRKLDGIDEEFLRIRPPVHMKRNVRSLRFQAELKGSELRTIMLIYFPFLLKDELPTRSYQNSMTISSSVAILQQLEISEFEFTLVDKALRKAVQDFEQLYGKENCTLSLHLLTHLSDMVRRTGSLTRTSTFIFESVLGGLLTLVKGTQGAPLQMISKYHQKLSMMAKADTILRTAPEKLKTLYTSLTTYGARRQLETVINLKDVRFLGKKQDDFFMAHSSSTVAVEELLQVNPGDLVGSAYSKYFGVMVDGGPLHSKEYTRFEKRSNYYASIDDGDFFEVEKILVVSSDASSEPEAIATGYRWKKRRAFYETYIDGRKLSSKCLWNVVRATALTAIFANRLKSGVFAFYEKGGPHIIAMGELPSNIYED